MAKESSFIRWALEPYGIGIKLRDLRTRKRLTLARLAAETGLSTALLSKLETERMIPTLPTLATISRVYGVNLSYFFRNPEHHSLAITRRAHLEQSNLRMEPPRSIPLNANHQRPQLLAEMVEMSSTATSPENSSPDTALFVHVLEGTLHLNSNGMTQVLEQGDCGYIETRIPITWKSAGREPCRLLLVRPGVGGSGV